MGGYAGEGQLWRVNEWDKVRMGIVMRLALGLSPLRNVQPAMESDCIANRAPANSAAAAAAGQQRRRSSSIYHPYFPTMLPATQPLEYNDGLLSGAAGPSICGPGASSLAKLAAHRMAHTLRGNHRPLDIIAFGGSVTHGDTWQGVIDGNVFPRVLASQLVERGLARSVRVRNLAIGATHGAAPMALCCDTLIYEGSSIRTLDLSIHNDARRWPWEVNRTFRGQVPPAEMSSDAPPPIILLEFSVNGGPRGTA